MNNGKKLFGINSTNACKGVALILLLWHHLFRLHLEYGLFVNKFAVLSKVCVAIFIILSGYGYSESIKLKKVGLFEFYKNRLIRLYANYWLIALIFIPIGIFFYDRTFQEVFTSHPYIKFLIQMAGLHRFAYKEYGFNPTWWYMSVIIPLVVLFPFIYNLTEKYGVLILIGFLLLILPTREILPVINPWLLPFALGIFLSQKNYITEISNRINILGNWRFLLLMILIVLVAKFRNDIYLLKGVEIDWLFGSLIILFVFELTILFNIVETTLSFLGKHLFNIFLFHSFIFRIYWEDFIYSFKYPLLIFIVLLATSLIISLIIEQFKKVIRFKEITTRITRLKIPRSIEIEFRRQSTDLTTKEGRKISTS